MRYAFLAAILAASVGSYALPAGDRVVERLATCQDSWFEWKDDASRMKRLAESLQAAFVQKGDGGAWVPRTPLRVVGLNVVQVFPGTVGMGVGYSLIVDANFDRARARVEQAVGKRFEACESGEGMRSCSRELGPKRTLVVMTNTEGAPGGTLIGCYYFYEK